MNIVVLGGSPKGGKSVTMQYVLWLQQKFSDCTFNIIQVCQPVAQLEKEPARLQDIAGQVRQADGVIWAFPVYVGLVPAGYKRFIELVFEHGLLPSFAAKPAALLCTSIHFFDSTATDYMRGVCEDMGMAVGEVFSPQMGELISSRCQSQLALFLKKWQLQMKARRPAVRTTAPVVYTPKAYVPQPAPTPPRHAMRVGIVTQRGVSKNLDLMVEEISKLFAETEPFDLSCLHIAGACTGCLQCAYNNTCLYEGKDDVIDAYRSLTKCDAILFCAPVVDRYFSARWKTFIDRMFFTTHIPLFEGVPMGFVVAGPLGQLPNLRAVLEGVYSTYGAIIAGFATDEAEDIDSGLLALAESLAFCAQHRYSPPQMFPTVFGRVTFRDIIYGGLSGVFVADHQYYKKHGLYDFPQKRYALRFAGALLRLGMRLPPVRRRVQQNMKDLMLMAEKRAVADAEALAKVPSGTK